MHPMLLLDVGYAAVATFLAFGNSSPSVYPIVPNHCFGGAFRDLVGRGMLKTRDSSKSLAHGVVPDFPAVPKAFRLAAGTRIKHWLETKGLSKVVLLGLNVDLIKQPNFNQHLGGSTWVWSQGPRG